MNQSLSNKETAHSFIFSTKIKAQLKQFLKVIEQKVDWSSISSAGEELCKMLCKLKKGGWEIHKRWPGRHFGGKIVVTKEKEITILNLQ